jgi:alpha-galactosidase
VGRLTSLKTRGDVAFTGAFGYELDVSLLGAEDREEVKRQTGFYKEVRQLLLRGDLYRLCSPFDSNEAAWMVVSPDKGEALVTHVTILAPPNAPQRFLRLKGLDAAAKYQIDNFVRRGDALMNIGLPIPYPSGDFVSCQWRLSRTVESDRRS